MSDRSDDRPLLLTLRALGLGDLLVAVPALRGLRRAFPHHRHVLLTPEWLRPVVDLTDAVDDVIPLDARTPDDGWPPVPAVAPPAVAVNLHGRGPQSHRLLLATRPGRLVAFAHPDVPESVDGPPWIDDDPEGPRAGELHEVERWCGLLASAGIDADPTDLRLRAPRAAVPAVPVTVVHPGASSAARRWPAERFAAVARKEAAAGRWVVVTGSADEARLVASVVRQAGLPTGAARVGGSMAGLLGLVSVADRVVTGDTGVAHLATAFATPSVVLFGPTPPARWGPPAGDPAHRVLWAGTIGDPHGRTVDPGLLCIGVDDVLAALASLPEPTRSAPQPVPWSRPPADPARPLTPR